MSLFDYGLGLNVLIISNLMRKKASRNNEIRSLLNQTKIEFQNKNHDSATLQVEESYLENYEFIKTPLTEKMRL
ncbi:MAG TPA: hypothetical protein VFH19_01845 [Nitrososphaeraceae archaeon]|nr:hypothetical protein [Nitrososphaeraceae archaeon]